MTTIRLFALFTVLIAASASVTSAIVTGAGAPVKAEAPEAAAADAAVAVAAAAAKKAWAAEAKAIGPWVAALERAACRQEKRTTSPGSATSSQNVGADDLMLVGVLIPNMKKCQRLAGYSQIGEYSPMW
eukprot:CAMPEP_0177344186 /NCGR_PEP_ID=MMETSP0368-20130122/27977_1 /TAXON_ID=447022 ORGANISM="Scrippsiella hangoei-like, Strain SHHI-4" /NCGR_SAMPLE_ID=MMETSP0368 /ASSEMBLY_ACC=CAM_ASM_000363 /LENGTH=128 /DNA_ID=CAMNT_0018805673 /DNA_START=67 /DNA_END=450 /DNA_ORIENTATION=+